MEIGVENIYSEEFTDSDDCKKAIYNKLYKHKFLCYAILTINEEPRLISIKDGKISEISFLSFPSDCNFIIGNFGWIAAFTEPYENDEGTGEIRIAKIDDSGNINYFPSVMLPDGFTVCNIRFYDNTMFFAGSSNGENNNTKPGEIAGYVDLECAPYQLNFIAIPQQFLTWGKSIDDILFIGNKMILVDNLMMPKYLFEYDMRDFNKPQFIKSIEFKAHTTYESVHKAEISEKYIVLLSRGINHGRESQFVTILDINSYQERNYFESSQYIYGESKENTYITDFCLARNKIYIATESDKIFVKNVLSRNRELVNDYITVEGFEEVNKIFNFNDHLLIANKVKFALIKL